MTVAAYVEPSNYQNIQAAIYDVGLNLSGVTFNGHKLGELPTADDLSTQGTPFWAVRSGMIVDWLQDNERGIGTTMPVWEFDVYALQAPYTPGSDTHVAAQATMMSLYTAFLANYDLENTCFEASPHRMGVMYLTVSGTEYVAAKLSIRAVEILDIRYS